MDPQPDVGFLGILTTLLVHHLQRGFIYVQYALGEQVAFDELYA
jgi:hypothetical protein